MDYGRQKGTLSDLDFKQKVSYFLGVLVLLGVVFFFYNQRAESSYGIDIHEKDLVLRGPDSVEAITILFDDIESVNVLSEVPNIGKAVNGVELSRLYFGTFQNEAYGEYKLCIAPFIKNAIEVHTAKGVVVFNYESKEVTENLGPTLAEFVLGKQ